MGSVSIKTFLFCLEIKALDPEPDPVVLRPWISVPAKFS